MPYGQVLEHVPNTYVRDQRGKVKPLRILFFFVACQDIQKPFVSLKENCFAQKPKIHSRDPYKHCRLRTLFGRFLQNDYKINHKALGFPLFLNCIPRCLETMVSLRKNNVFDVSEKWLGTPYKPCRF